MPLLTKEIDIHKKEKIKDLLKPIRKAANEATGNEKMAYDEMLRQIDERFPKGKVSRYELATELQRQQVECELKLEETKRQVNKLDKGGWYVHWKDLENGGGEE